MAIINALKTSRLFGGLSQQELAKVSGISRAKSYSGGTLIFSQGDEARGFFLIAKGTVRIFQLSPDGKEHLLHTFHDSESFGEAAAFGMGIFPANAETIGESELIFVPLKDFKLLLSQNPDLSVKIIANLSMLLHILVEQIASLTLKDATTRIIEYILSLVKEKNACGRVILELPIKKGALASRLNITQETLSRGFQKLRAQKLLKVEGKSITIENLPSLRAIIENPAF